MVSMNVVMGIFLPATIWPGGLAWPQTEMSTRNISQGSKAAGA